MSAQTGTPPDWCKDGAVVNHRTSGHRARIQRVYFNMSFGWRVVLAGGTEFVDQVNHPGARAVANAMPLEMFTEWWGPEKSR